MSKFNSYARKVNDIALAAFEEYHKAEAALKKAEATARQYPNRYGADHEYLARAARAQADYLQAKEDMKTAKRVFEGHKSEIAALRKELVEDLNDHYAADPRALDNNTLELMKAGILKPAEYSRLMSKAQEAGNHTMARMIAKYAGDAAAEIGKRYGENSAEAREMRTVAYMGSQTTGEETLQTFDFMADVYSRSVNNPAMIDAWGELTSDAVENM